MAQAKPNSTRSRLRAHAPDALMYFSVALFALIAGAMVGGFH